MNRYAVSLRNKPRMENLSPLSNCKSILQEIVWTVENWENIIRSYNINKEIEEIKHCEGVLCNVKDQIWRSCLSLCCKYNSQGNSHITPEEMTGSRPSVSNTEMVLHERISMPVAVHQRESAKTVIMSNSPQQPIKNLLLDWAVSINSNFQLVVVGSLPDAGAWETSPIAVRIGPTTVKTTSGTTYNMHGPMVINEDQEVPDFVAEKFHYGFPLDWKEVANKWINMLKMKEKGRLSGPTDGRQSIDRVAHVVLTDIQKEAVYNRNNVAQQQEQFAVPASKEKSRKPTNPASSSVSPVLKKASPWQKVPRNEKATDKSRSKVGSVVPRHSKRLLSKSLMDTSSVSEMDANMDDSLNEENFKYLKEWCVEYSRKYNGLILKGTLINKEGNIVAEDYKTAGVARRIFADLVETEEGQHYRLVGASSYVFSDIKDFDFGFPIHWERLIEKLKSRPVNRGRLRRRSSLARTSTTTNNTRNVSQSSSQVKHHTKLINHMVKHQLSKAHSETLGKRNNGMLPSKNSSMDAKRKADSFSLSSGNVAPIKKIRTASVDAAQAPVNRHDDSLGNESIGEIHWKQELIKKMQNEKHAKVGPKKTPATESTTFRENQPSKSTTNPTKPVIKPAVNDKYILGLATDECESENDFNIF